MELNQILNPVAESTLRIKRRARQISEDSEFSSTSNTKLPSSNISISSAPHAPTQINGQDDASSSTHHKSATRQKIENLSDKKSTVNEGQNKRRLPSEADQRNKSFPNFHQVVQSVPSSPQSTEFYSSKEKQYVDSTPDKDSNKLGKAWRCESEDLGISIQEEAVGDERRLERSDVHKKNRKRGLLQGSSKDKRGYRRKRKSTYVEDEAEADKIRGSQSETYEMVGTT